MMVGPSIAFFWLCLASLLYVYVLYPGLIFLIGRLFGRLHGEPSDPPPDGWPRISLLLAAYNEESVLVERLENALAMDYPADRFEIVVGSDGSVDGTAEVVGRFAGRGVRLLDFAERQGKAAVLNRAMPTLSGEIVLLSDANTLIAPDAARKLVRWFARPDVCCVCGKLVLTDPATGKNSDGLYWKYETFIKRSEARLGALLGANGAIYALRRDHYEPLPSGTIIDDFVIPLLSLLRRGGLIFYEPGAVASEESAPDVAAEFRRRCRIGAGGFQCLALLWPLLDPRRGWLDFAFLSHKLLRWLGPFFLIGMIATNLSLATSGPTLWRWVMAAQAIFYAMSFVTLPGNSTLHRLLRLAAMFTSMNVALLVGFWGWLTGRWGGTWTPTARPVAATGPGR